MATVAEKIAESLTVLKKIQDKEHCVVLQSTNEISRTHLNRLIDSGWLQEVIRGWYIASRPGAEGDTTVWYTSFWYFIAKYANVRFGNNWCFTAEQSLVFYSGKDTVPKQLIIKSPSGNNTVQKLMHDTSMLTLQGAIPENINKDTRYGLNLMTLEEALVYASPSYFTIEPIAARTCLAMLKDSDKILKVLLRKGSSVRAGRLIGALRNIGRTELADTIAKTMKNLGYDVREEDPFSETSTVRLDKAESTYATRIRLMWSAMRETVVRLFPTANSKISDASAYLKDIDAKYEKDAYHSLSIEGYKVSEALIEKVKSGNWHPDEDDKEHKNALVARGYYQAFQSVKSSIEKIISGENAGKTAKEDSSIWYMQMWMPFVEAGILSASDLVGYRTNQVYIRGSMHVPLNPDAVREAMPVLFELLEKEPHAGVRAVLGHFFFVFIHPYMDGNGRMARFLLNAMLASGGYKWTIVPMEVRDRYMRALEKASTTGDIEDFARLIVGLTEGSQRVGEAETR